MRSNIQVDDELISQVMHSFDAPTKDAAVEMALKIALKIQGQASIRELFGKVEWEGDLEQSRLGRNVG
ncbi:MAG TPA: type II toxin-antitoxin system VapB family antitoxin [Acidobacteriaceae bacterium]